jgi:hypothetical protein
MIKWDFVSKGIEQFDHSSQESDLEYEKYLVLFRKWSLLVNVAPSHILQT